MHFQTKENFLCGDYARLSREDGDKIESDSIKNQKTLIAEYHENHPELKVVEEYVDDGYSGTNFSRPGFQRMIDDAKSGKINCIIVKDLSRFGRDYIEVGRYLEQTFPLLGIRFIAINDHYDSVNGNDDGNQILVPFKNLINEAYCRDISTKTRSSLNVKKRDGQFVGNFAAYGYRKDPDNKNHLVIDEYAAEIVRLIFNLKIQGMSGQHIANRLNEMGVLPPMEYKLSCGLKFYSGFRAYSDEKWSVTAVLRILNNELYTGTMVQGKRQKINYKLKQTVDLEEDQWIKVKDTHEAIVSRAVFNQVQRIMETDTRTSPNEDTVFLFSGFLRCGDCGQSMTRRHAHKGARSYNYYQCSGYKHGNGCTSHLINENVLIDTVLASIRRQAAMLVDAEAIILEAEKIPENNFAVKSIDAQLNELADKVARYHELKVHLYMDAHDEVVSQEEFEEMNKRFTGMIEKGQDRIKHLEEEKKNLLRKENRIQPWLEDFKKYRSISRLDRNVVIALIDHIDIHDKRNIEIHFRYEDEMQLLIGQAGMSESADVACVGSVIES